MAEVDLASGDVALIDEEDIGLVSAYSWGVQRNKTSTYAKAYVRGSAKRIDGKQVGAKFVYMHRLIMGNPDCDVDHINGDGLDNRRANLRLATRSENIANKRKLKTSSSKYKGVTRAPCGGWIAQIAPNGQHVHIGVFVTEEAAAAAYNAAAKTFFGEFARLNEIAGAA